MTSTGMLLDLYRCVDAPQRWSTLLDRLCDQTGAASAVVQVLDLRADQAQIVWQAGDSRSSTLRSQLAGSGNPRIDRRRMLRCASRVVADDDLFERDDPGRRALQQLLADAGLGAFLGHLLPQADDRYIGIALHRAAGTGDAFEPGTPACLTELAPHVGEAVRLGQRLHRVQRDLQQHRAHLDQLRCAALVCDAEARVQWMNRSAGQLVQAGSLLGLNAGLLRAGTPGQTAQLRHEIAAAARAGDGAARWLALANADRQLHLALRRQAVDDGPPCVLVTLTDPHEVVDAPAHTWCRLLGLTPAEGVLVAALAQGRTLEAHATERGVALGTVRNQLKQVLAKTGTSRQADLVRLALGSAAAQCRPGD